MGAAIVIESAGIALIDLPFAGLNLEGMAIRTMPAPSWSSLVRGRRSGVA
jgi:hypothetical protein